MLYPVSNLRVKTHFFKIRLFDIFKKHIRLKKNSATTKLFLFFVIILSTTTFQTLRKKFHRLIDVCCILYQCSLFHQTLPHFYSDVSFPQLLKNFDFRLTPLKRYLYLQNENTRFWSDFMFTKWQKHVFQAVSCYKMKKQAFEVFFTFTKRKHDLIWSDFMLMKWKNTLLKRFSCLQHKKHVFEALFMFTKWKKVLKRLFFHVNKTKITFLKRLSCLQNGKASFWRDFHLYKMKKHMFWRVLSTKW